MEVMAEEENIKMSEDKDQDHEINVDNVSKERNKIHDVIYTIKPALIFENWFGKFRFGVTETGLVPPNRKMKMLGIMVTILYIVLFSVLIDIPTAITETSTLVDMIDELPFMVVVIQYIASAISILFFLSKTTIQIFTTFVELDTALRVNIFEDFYKKCRSKTNRFLLLLTIIHVLFSLSDMLTDDEFKLRKLLIMAMYTEQDLEIFVFCKMVLMLRSRLIIINDYLAKFVQEKDNNRTPIFIVNEKETIPEKQFNFIGRISPNNMKIRDLAAMYDTIGNTCSLINDVFKFQIFMNLVSTFTYIVVTIWTSLYYFRTSEGMNGQLLTVIIWCILMVLSVAVLSFTCESLLTTRKQTKLLVNEIIMDYDLPRTMRIQAKVFMELIEAWPLRIFVYDMFSIDIKLMLKFVSVATTYLIVIIQISHFV